MKIELLTKATMVKSVTIMIATAGSSNTIIDIIAREKIVPKEARPPINSNF